MESVDSQENSASGKQRENMENNQASSSDQPEKDYSDPSEHHTANSGIDSASDRSVPSGDGNFKTIEQSVRPQRTDSVDSHGESSAVFVPVQDPMPANRSRQRAESVEQSGRLPSLISDFTASDTSDFEDLLTPRTLSPALGPWSIPGVTAFTPDSTHLYCFSHVYDPIPEEEEEESGQRSKTFQRMVDNLDASCSPELVIAIISSRRDAAARNFINQVGDVSLHVLTGEASFIRRLCRACFTL